MAKRKPKLLVYGSTLAGYRWRLIAANGRIVAASSEAFVSRRGAWRNAETTCDLLVILLLQEEIDRTDREEARGDA
ncbi:MAG: DUF1508 domain-containing protein [Myxococcota bacterium]